MAKIKKIVKSIKIDADKCNGCRACELVCSGYHATPKFSTVNPARARIKVVTYRLKDIWFPIFAGEYTKSGCVGRDSYIIEGKEYAECEFCRAACPTRDRFKEPDSGIPLRCDMCESDPPLDKPMCVQACINDVLTFEEREEEVEEEVAVSDMELGLQAYADTHGMNKLLETVARMAQKG
jgi:Fe-S-cluster-containing dehydrogenase component